MCICMIYNSCVTYNARPIIMLKHLWNWFKSSITTAVQPKEIQCVSHDCLTVTLTLSCRLTKSSTTFWVIFNMATPTRQQQLIDCIQGEVVAFAHSKPHEEWVLFSYIFFPNPISSMRNDIYAPDGHKHYYIHFSLLFFFTFLFQVWVAITRKVNNVSSIKTRHFR